MKNPSPFEARGCHGDRIAKRGKRQDRFVAIDVAEADPSWFEAPRLRPAHLTMRAERTQRSDEESV